MVEPALPALAHSPGAAADADAEAFDAFVAAVEPRVRRALVAVAGPDAARDATTDALVHAWRRWDRVQAMGNPAGYVYTVARSRIRVPDQPLPLDDDAGRGGGGRRRSREAVVEIPDVEPRLARILATLPERQRVAVYLLHGCGWSTPEVAALLDVSVSTVRNHVARALDRLRRDLGVVPATDTPTHAPTDAPTDGGEPA
jgi:RNA polymerase sigma-70 factor (ECF subfamily)